MRKSLLLFAAGSCVAFAAYRLANGLTSDVPSLLSMQFAAPAHPVSPQPIATKAAGNTTASASSGEFAFAPYDQYRPMVDCGAGCQYAVGFEAVKIGDVTGDGRDDLVAAPSDNQIWVLRQRPDGTMDTTRPIVFTYSNDNYIHPAYLLLGDVNEDGVLDIVSATIDPDTQLQGGIAVVLSRNGGLVFSNLSFPLESWSGGQLIDIDLDGHLDLVAYSISHDGYSSSSRVVFNGDGRGNFTWSGTKVPLGTLQPAGAADFNNDGLQDMAVFTSPYTAESQVSVFLNDLSTGFGTLSPIGPSPINATLTAYGDFNHDGRTDIAAGAWIFLQKDGFAFPLAYQMPQGTLHPASALADDFDGDGMTDLLLPQFRDGHWNNLQVYLQRKGVLVASAEGPMLADNFTDNLEQLASGDLNGDGCRDVAQANAQSGITIFRGMNCQRLPAVLNDFDGDRKSDILWRNQKSGRNVAWKSASFATPQFVATVSDVAWKIAGTGDFDGNGKADILWRNGKTGANAIWKSAYYRTPQAVGGIPDMAWAVAGVGDFDGNGKSDILWRNSTTHANVLWLDGSFTRSRVLSSVNNSWRVDAIGDFDGDKRDDILWRNPSTGQGTIWLAGNSATHQSVGLMEPSWKVAGAGDFNRDGKDDILWRNAVTGANVAWRGANAASPLTVTSIKDLHWHVAGLGDYNADGAADILWRNDSTGSNAIWLSANKSRAFAVMTVPDPTWVAQ